MDIRAKTMTIEQRKEKLLNLVNNFTENYKYYKTPDFDESNTRLMFIDPLFECFGWDIKNEKCARPDRREVITEDRVIITGETKFPDYVFCYGGERKYFVEAKKPAVDIRNHPEPARQVRRYAYTAKLPISILTDFEEFSIYDTRIKPNKDDDPSKARIFYCKFQDYLENFDKLYKWISWEAIDLGSFDTYTEEVKDKKGTSQVDDDILKLIDDWRTVLAEDIAKHNEIDIFNLNTAVQKIIDRIVFLRIAEDKQIENYGELKNTLEKKGDNLSIYQRLCILFEKANKVYNAGLFSTDLWLNELNIEDKTLANIINHIYYPECPYEFSVLPIEILGSIYEKFLGKVIQFTRKTKFGHSIEIENKPEVQKAGGVYYTPRYIVKYIVENTIGTKIQSLSPQEVSLLRFVDPACGSGSFLVGAYQFLLDWHMDYYYHENNRAKAEKQNKIYYDELSKRYKLSIEEKKNILINNIYGVDIDAQAVEVTKLSLFLKLLEDEGKRLANKHGQANLFRESDFKLLPTLNDNIKCGNSLIGTDYYAEKDLNLFGMEEQRKINVFDWDKAFAEIMKTGGFDCVIGNPPYFNINTLDKEDFHYLEKTYSEIHTGYNDIMYYFIYKSINLLNSTGLYGVITSNYYLGNSYAKRLRIFLKKHISKIVNFKDYLIFEDANVHTNIIIAGNAVALNEIAYFELVDKNNFHPESIENSMNFFNLQRDSLQDEWLITDGGNKQIIDKITDNSIKLGDISSIAKGPESGKNDVFTVSIDTINELNLEKDLLRKNVKNGDIDSYYFSNRDNYLIYVDNNTKIREYPNIYKYLLNSKTELLNRRGPLHNEYEWYRLHRPSIKEIFDAPEKLIVPYRAESNRFAYDNEQYFNDGGDIRALVLKANSNYKLKYLLGILNSKLMNWYYGFIGKPKGKSREYFNEPMALIPIRSIDINNPNDVILQNKLVSLSDQMVLIQKQFHNAKSESDKNLLKQKIDLIDNQIDSLVYKLYGLAEAEIKIVEG